MNLFLHEFTHILLSLLIGFIVWQKYLKAKIIFIAAFVGGVFVDLDHLLDYFLAFGNKFILTYFLKGYQFIKIEKIYIPLHAWELAFLLFLGVLLFKKNLKIKSLLLSFAFALLLHLLVDLKLNHVTFAGYSMIYRIKNNFNLQKLVTTEHYKTYLKEKSTIKFN